METNNDKDKQQVDTVFANEILIEMLDSWMKYLSNLKLLRLFMYRESYFFLLIEWTAVELHSQITTMFIFQASDCDAIIQHPANENDVAIFAFTSKNKNTVSG